MTRRPAPPLTELQLAILRELWRGRELSVTDVHAALARERDLAPTTVATLLRRLERRGVVTHRVEGRQYLYRALVREEEATHAILNDVAERLFAGDVPALMSQLLRAREVAPGDLERLRALLDEHDRDAG